MGENGRAAPEELVLVCRGAACGAAQCELGFGPQSLPPLRRAPLAWWGLWFKTNRIPEFGLPIERGAVCGFLFQ